MSFWSYDGEKDRRSGWPGDSQTFWLVFVVMASPLGRSRAILCFLISCTDTTGMAT